ncbi:MAG: ABC transporter permease subunit [Alphaproteobacteria bacterium]|nr:ABC transporter permease subunit [Alphaproteobacteria bacterium]
MHFKYSNLSSKKIKRRFNIWDVCAIAIVIWLFVILKNAMEYMYSPVPLNISEPVSLDPINLPEYVFRSIVRIVLALIASVIFSIIYALIAAKNKHLQKAMISLLDIMQSIPILGYISFTITGFIALAPHHMLGFELAVIFTVFTCQVWNITYSIYQSLITIPENIKNAESIFKLNALQRFLLVEFPYAIPSLVWNIMISISNSWFFVVASEAIIEGNNSFFLPGVGSYIASAIGQKDLHSIFYAIIVMAVVILLYDKFTFRPLVAWAQKFKYDFGSVSSDKYVPWNKKLFTKSKVMKVILLPFEKLYRYLLSYKFSENPEYTVKEPICHKPTLLERVVHAFWCIVVFSLSGYALYKVSIFLYKEIPIYELKYTLYLGLITTLRIIVVMLITIVIWLPISIYIGFNPKLARIAQPLALTFASFPANLIFPLCVFVIQKYSLNPDIWLSVLLIISIQWYLVFNIISGASTFPDNLKNVVKSFDIKGVRLLWKVLVPAILPHFLIGAITAWGSAWNATIIAEFAEWGTTTLEATGIGSYVTKASNAGEMSNIILGILVMLFYIEIFNRLFWRPLFKYADKMEQFK